MQQRRLCVPHVFCSRQLICPLVPNFTPCASPPHAPIHGRYCSLLPVDTHSIAHHAAALYDKYNTEGDATWTYLPYGPFGGCDAYKEWLLSLAEKREGLTNDAIP